MALRLSNADKGWRRRFDEPIPLRRGRQLVTLKDAGNYIACRHCCGEQNLMQLRLTWRADVRAVKSWRPLSPPLETVE